MESDEIRQMFRDAADLRKMGPFDKDRKATEERFETLAARYRAEYLSAQPEPREEKPRQPEWKAALSYIASLLQQMDAVAPESAKMNHAAFAVIAPAVQKYYEEKNSEKKGEPAE